MNQVPQMATVADLRHKHLQVFARLNEGPVIIAQRSKPAAVLVSVDQWDNMAGELSRLRRIIKADKLLAEMKTGNYVDLEDLDKALAAD